MYRASDLEASSFEDEDAPEQSDGDGPITGVVSEAVDGLEDLPEGWDRDSVLEYWSSIGGAWEKCVEELTDEWGAGTCEGALLGDKGRGVADPAVAKSVLAVRKTVPNGAR